MKKKHFTLLILGMVIIAALIWANRDMSTTTTTTNKSSDSSSFNKKANSLSDPNSTWVVVNKQRQLSPKTYAPSDLTVPNIPMRSNITNTEKQVRQVTATALEKMVADAKKEGFALNLQSGYRSYDFQVALYDRYVSEQGKAVADSQSARPGYSEHQTGLAADLGSASHPECDVADCFGDTPEGKWLAANAYKYGFIIRYPENLTNITGYIPEPWHIRYTGVDLAAEMHKKGVLTLEQFFDLPAAPDYE
jgi:D-alanyl-D-alanine carboxypeptidase